MLTIESDQISLALTPEYGARVVSLTDRKSGRQWLVTGPQSTQTGEDAVYSAQEAVGWDECFPTVLACNNPSGPGRLRDHGVLWGREWIVDRAEADCVETRFETSLFRFSRRLTLKGATVFADYRLTNLGAPPLPYLWSQHCLLAAMPGDRIVLTGHEKFYSGRDNFSWPHHPDRDLSVVGPISEGFALKSYAETPGYASAAVSGPNGGICLEWDNVPAFGLWLCYGGWPEGNPVHQIALEPTTAATDHLAAAGGLARVLAQNQAHTWSVRMTLTDDDITTLR